MNDINELITRYLSGEATPAETERLNRWLAEDERHLRYFFRQKNVDDVCRPAFPPSAIDTEQAWKRVLTETEEKRVRKGPGGRRRLPGAGGSRRRRAFWRNIAAAAVLFIAIGLTLIYRYPAVAPDAVPAPAAQHPLLSHAPAAVLVLPTGEEIVLDGQRVQGVGDNRHPVAEVADNSIRYLAADSNRSEMIYHELRVPSGGEFFLKLSDGSRIWLNAASKVRYPVHFAAHERKIYLEGEAYLEVAPEAASPFRVETPHCEVTVLGTRFNINAYTDEPRSFVTLAGGKVQVSTDGQQLVLIPGEQAVIGHASGELTKLQVDPDMYCCWHEGRILFKNEPLEEILRRLERWYDVKIDWQDDSLKRMTFSGELRKYEKIDKLLELISRTRDVRFSIDDRQIQVTAP